MAAALAGACVVPAEAAAIRRSGAVELRPRERFVVEQQQRIWRAATSGREQCRSGVRIRAAKKVETGRSLVMSSTLVAEEGKEEAVVDLCKGILDWASECQKSDKACGVLQFECKADLQEKNVYHFWERYESFLHLTTFRGSPEHVKFMKDVRPLLKKPIGLVAYEYKDGQIGHARVLIGPKGEGGLDDATGQGKQTSRLIAPGDTYDDSREDWGLKEALEAKKKQKAKQWEAMERQKQAFLARSQKGKDEDEPLSPEEAARQKKALAEILGRFEAEKAAKAAQEKENPGGAAGWGDGIKNLFGLKK
ncbi:uncharacterized protein LOC112341984 isoform X1 [Selaginella moellendorffii]|uniref:uncharacterized protein LOC112341984 isoform X1 n=1 Tax=Selaginella moellendorffii TaxID=88036 RepID=UPI000D1C837C|nr:uncharacterized protein LOC112341984 isoform X1 [Selaginella moellendorffii]|eukprot:XP_024518820.1 uncharacterized protein LOC112341984 isoform X1 [Selaginella moellendorffii]